MINATRQHHLRVAAWLLENRPDACVDKFSDALQFAASNGEPTFLQQLEAYRLEALTPAVMDSALENRQWDVILYLHTHPSGVGGTIQAFEAAASRGHLDVVQFLHKNQMEGSTTEAMDRAAAGGHLATAQFLHEHRTEGCTDNALDHAASGGHLETVQWLHKHRSEGCTAKAMDVAARHGFLHAVTFLHEHRTEGCTSSALLRATKRGHGRGGDFAGDAEGDSAGVAARARPLVGGNVETVQYLHEYAGFTFHARLRELAKYSRDSALITYVAEH